jgi:hypothetical protein
LVEREVAGGEAAEPYGFAAADAVFDACVRAVAGLQALRSRLADAISNRHLLPVGFVTALGSTPPARQTDR